VRDRAGTPAAAEGRHFTVLLPVYRHPNHSVYRQNTRYTLREAEYSYLRITKGRTLGVEISKESKYPNIN
jgi:hypothetical protein